MGSKRRKAPTEEKVAEKVAACNASTGLFADSSKYKTDYSHTQAAPELPKVVIDPTERAPANARGTSPPSSSREDDDNEQPPSRKKTKLIKTATRTATKRPSTDKTQSADTSKDDLLRELKDEALPRTVFVGNLASATTKKRLKKHFEPYGAIESIRFRSHILKKDSRVPRRVAAAAGTVDDERGSHHAYIVFEDAASVSKALHENMKVLDDHHIRVDRAAVNGMRVKLLGAKKGARAAAELIGTSHQVQYDVTRTAFVGNLPLQIEDEHLIRFFIAGLGAGSESLIQAVRVVRDPKTSVGKGIAFVLFKTRGARKSALALNGKALDGRKLRISEAKADGSSEAAQYKRSGRGTSDKNKSWQGATSSKSGRVRGGVTKKSTGNAYSNTLKKASKRPQMPKRVGKRPAVAARKAAAKAAGTS